MNNFNRVAFSDCSFRGLFVKPNISEWLDDIDADRLEDWSYDFNIEANRHGFWYSDIDVQVVDNSTLALTYKIGDESGRIYYKSRRFNIELLRLCKYDMLEAFHSECIQSLDSCFPKLV